MADPVEGPPPRDAWAVLAELLDRFESLLQMTAEDTRLALETLQKKTLRGVIGMIESHAVTSPEQWLKMRREFNDITASVAPALFGLHPYVTPLQLWMAKSGKLPLDNTDNPMTRRGRLVEKLGPDLIQEARPEWTVEKCNVYVRDPERRLGCTPDFAVHTPSGLRVNIQFKSIEPYTFERTWRVDGEIVPPTWVGIQTLLETYLTGADSAMVGVCRIGFGIDFDLIEVPRTDGLIERLQEAAAAFWESLKDMTPPSADYLADAELLGRLYPTAVAGKSIDLTGNNRVAYLAEEDARLAAALKETEGYRKALKAEVLDLLRDAELGLVDGEVVVSAKRVDVPAHQRKASSYRKIVWKDEKK